MPAQSRENPDRRSEPRLFSVFSKENNYSKIVKIHLRRSKFCFQSPSFILAWELLFIITKVL